MKTASLFTMTLAMLSVVHAAMAENCFYSGALSFTHRGVDPAGNFTNMEEYWMKKNKNCTFVQDGNSKVDWFSSSITVYYALAYDF